MKRNKKEILRKLITHLYQQRLERILAIMNILIYSTNSHYLDKPVGGAETSLRFIADKIKMIKNMEYKVLEITDNGRWFANNNYNPDKNIRKYQSEFASLINDEI